MTHYEQYHKERPEITQAIKNIRLSMGKKENGEKDPQNDKATFRFSAGMNRQKPKLLNETWTPALLTLQMSYGYYGSSSGYRSIDETTALYVMRACNELKVEIAAKAIALAERDLEKLRQRAADEARDVLAETQK